MTRNIQYSLVEPDILARTAGILGQSSAAWQALNDLVRRGQNGEIPICIQAKSKNQRSGTYVVFDMRNPPDELPQEWRNECRKQAANLDADIGTIDTATQK